MPHLTNWVMYNGKTYCLDNEAKMVAEVEITDLSLDQVPKEVLIAMLSNATKD